MTADVVLEPLAFRNLAIKNRIVRSSVAGRFDNYDGSGTQVRINWDLKFAQGGVGAIVSSNAPVDERGLMAPGFAHIDRDDRIPFWRKLAERVHEHDCKYIVQLFHAGRQRPVGGIHYGAGLSATDKPDPVHGYPTERMTVEQIAETVQAFARAAARAREAGLDGVELGAAGGGLFTQFLSSAINDRKDEYGGSLENRARFTLEVVRAVRAEVGDDFHVQVKLSAAEHLNEVLPWLRRGNGIAESIQVCKWLEDAGVDAFHITAGATFPHPRNPAGLFPLADVVRTYDSMLSSGIHTFRNYLLYRTWPFSRLMKWWWERPARGRVEGINLPLARAIKEAIGVPVLANGGFQTASVIAGAIERGDCDGVTIARSLVANPDLTRLFAEGHDRPPKPCTYVNKCVMNLIENPVGCYDESRFSSHEEMIEEIFSIYEPVEEAMRA